MNDSMYEAEIRQLSGKISVTLFCPAGERLFRRTFHNICDAEGWLTTLARKGLSQRGMTWLDDVPRFTLPLSPFRAIRVKDERISKRARLPACFA